MIKQRTRFCERISELEKEVDLIQEEIDILMAKGSENFEIRWTKYRLGNAHEALEINRSLREFAYRKVESGTHFMQ